MILSDLYKVLFHIKQAVEEVNLLALYRNLVDALNQARQNPSTEVSQIIGEIKEGIKKINLSNQPEYRTANEEAIFEQLGAQNLIGYEANLVLDDMFLRNQANPSGAAAEVNLHRTNIANMLKQVNNIVAYLDATGVKIVEEEVSKEAGILQIVFQSEASVKSIADLAKASNNWKRILSSFGRLTNTTADGIEISYV